MPQHISTVNVTDSLSSPPVSFVKAMTDHHGFVNCVMLDQWLTRIPGFTLKVLDIQRKFPHAWLIANLWVQSLIQVLTNFDLERKISVYPSDAIPWIAFLCIANQATRVLCALKLRLSNEAHRRNSTAWDLVSKHLWGRANMRLGNVVPSVHQIEDAMITHMSPLVTIVPRQ